MVNVVDDPAYCDFILPSYLRRGGIILAVSTSGMSPALARKIRTRLEQELGKEYETLAIITHEVRAQLKREKIRPGSSRWQQALDLDRLTALIRQGRKAEAKNLLLANLKQDTEKEDK
jgi:siroheme synthase-like protein